MAGVTTTGRVTNLKQEDILGSIAAVDGELAGALLAGDDVQLRRKGGYGNHRLPGNVGPGDCQLQPLHHHQEVKTNANQGLGLWLFPNANQGLGL